MSDREQELLDYIKRRDERRRAFWIWGSIIAIILGSVGVGAFFAVKAKVDADKRHECEVNEYLGGPSC